MADVFGELYSRWYDTLYESKDYCAEVDFILRAAADCGMRAPHTVLDLGCGTGGHAFEMRRRGLGVTGVDRSEAMLEEARRMGAGSDGLRFVRADVRDVSLDERFDLVIMMFAVLGYQTGNEDVVAALRSVARHLGPDGIGVMDFWYGPAVLTTRPEDRVRVYAGRGGERLVRVSSGVLHHDTQCCEVRYRLIECGRTGCAEAEEVHLMRFFFPMELRLLAGLAGLEVVSLVAAACEPAASLGIDTWNAAAIVRSVGGEV